MAAGDFHKLVYAFGSDGVAAKQHGRVLSVADLIFAQGPKQMHDRPFVHEQADDGLGSLGPVVSFNQLAQQKRRAAWDRIHLCRDRGNG